MSDVSATILAIDQGTTGTTSLVVEVHQDATTRILGRGYAALAQHFPRPGWVEHEPEAIWQTVCKANELALAAFGQARGQPPADAARTLSAVALSNQRESALAWRPDGKPFGRSIVWQDRRTQPACAELRQAGYENLLRRRTGLVFDPYFTASKLAWMVAHDSALREACAAGQARMGTVDSFVLGKLTRFADHRTDTTNAARTALFDIHRLRWDKDLCRMWHDIPLDALAEVLPSDAVFGHTEAADGLPDGLPILGVLGDQHAALLGQACVRPGQAKCTLGTGGFVLLHTGETPSRSAQGLLTTVAYHAGGELAYALEGSMFVAGALIEWLQSGLGLIEHPRDIEALAQQVPDAGGVTIVPALTGLGAPHWRPNAKGLIAGLSRGTTRAHMARAALEGIAWQSAELLGAMAEDIGRPIDSIRLDGGAAKNDLLVQLHADFLQMEVERPASVDATALGAALCAAVGLKILPLARLGDGFTSARTFSPRLSRPERDQRLHAWRDVIDRV